MKKSLIATGAASLALAAMPLVGTFADSVTDTVQVTINSSCTVGATSGGTSGSATGRTYTTTLANGATQTWYATPQSGQDGGGAMTIDCNNASGWSMTAIGSSDTTHGATITQMNPDADGKTPISTGTSGDASYWAFQVAGNSTESAYRSFSAVPGTATPVASATGSSAAEVVNTGYVVHVSASQQAGTYTGKVTYTITPNA